MRFKGVDVQRFHQHICMLLPRLDVMDSNYTTLSCLADDVVIYVHVARTTLLKRLVDILIAPSLSSLIIMLPSIGGVNKPFTYRRKRTSFRTSASATYSDSDDAAAVTFCILENQLITPSAPSSLLRLKPNAECLDKWRNRRPSMPTVFYATPAFHRR